MSSYSVEIVKIDEVFEHPNAHSLDIARVWDWQSVVGKNSFDVGDHAIYIPIDSILGTKLEEFLFPPDAKVKLSKHRVRSVKIRGALSQGMLIGLRTDLINLYPQLANKRLGDDVADILGVAKYEPPAPRFTVRRVAKKGSWKNHPLFTKYTDIQNYKYYPDLFWDDDDVSVTEKVHGTSARYGRYPHNTNYRFGFITRWMIKFGLKPGIEFVFGSRNIQLQTGGKIYYKEDVYSRIAKEYDIENVLDIGESLYGEIVGPKIQKGYDYGFKDSYGFFAYDVKRDGKYLNVKEFEAWCDDRGIPRVPVLFEGKRGEADLDSLRNRPSTIAPWQQHVSEGIVMKPIKETKTYMGRKVLKCMGDEYLLKKQTDFH